MNWRAQPELNRKARRPTCITPLQWVCCYPCPAFENSPQAENGSARTERWHGSPLQARLDTSQLRVPRTGLARSLERSRSWSGSPSGGRSLREAAHGPGLARPALTRTPRGARQCRIVADGRRTVQVPERRPCRPFDGAVCKLRSTMSSRIVALASKACAQATPQWSSCCCPAEAQRGLTQLWVRRYVGCRAVCATGACAGSRDALRTS